MTTDNPFRRAGSRTMAALGIGGLLVVAAVITWRLTRDAPTPAPTADGHDHAAMVMSDSARPVQLDAPTARRIGVTYARVEAGALAPEVRSVAQVTIDERRTATIAPKVDGFVEELLVNTTGQSVGTGETLLRLYSPMLVAAQEELLVTTRLAARLGIGDSAARAESHRLREAARRRLEYWDIAPSQMDEIERTGTVQRTIALRSPVTGVVLQKNVVRGQRIMAGDALYQIADLRRVWLEGEIFERDLASVRVGDRVSAEFDALPGAPRSGRITWLNPVLNPDTRTARVRVELSNENMQLKPGMYGTIRVQTRGGPVGLLVPRSAVLSTGERHLVFVKRGDERYEPRLVTTGGSSDEQTLILSGLTLGDTVVRSATFLVDAESNLGTMMGGMGDMPGMDMAAPTTAPATKAKDAKGKAAKAPVDSAATTHKHD